MIFSTHAKSQYHAGVVSVNKRATGWWGGRISYTYSRLEDNQFAQGNYYSNSPGILNNSRRCRAGYYNPDAEYGISRLDSPHKLVASPISGCLSAKGSGGSRAESATGWRAGGRSPWSSRCRADFRSG